MVAALAVGALQGPFFRLLCRRRSYTGMVGPLVCADLWRFFSPVVRAFPYVPSSYLRPGVAFTYGFVLGVYVISVVLCLA